MRVDSLIKIADELKIKYSLNEAMALHTSFKLGGEADILLYPRSAEELKQVMSAAKGENIPLFILGNGSNLLVSDKGIDGAVVSTLGMNNIRLVNENEIFAEAGASLAALCTFAKDSGLTGMEFAYGIPGSVGGALYMNAGAYGGDMSQVVVSAQSINADGKVHTRPINELKLGYRQSIFKENGEVITGITVKLSKGNSEEIANEMNTIIAKRKKSQPLEYPSAGSTFKRPEGYYAAALIDECDLKGTSVGGAQVSTKHAGFVINTGGCSCSDVLGLIDIIKQTVLKKKGVTLETEVIFVGRN